MELAIINGTYRDPTAKIGQSGSGVAGGVLAGVGSGKGNDLLSICKYPFICYNSGFYRKHYFELNGHRVTMVFCLNRCPSFAAAHNGHGFAGRTPHTEHWNISAR